jgi:hypothetical protein
MGTPSSIGLAELLGQVRAELDLAQAKLRDSGATPKMDWDSAEVEISFGVTKEAGADGKVSFHVFAVGARGSCKAEQVHRLTLHLKPHEQAAPAARKAHEIDLSRAVARVDKGK